MTRPGYVPRPSLPCADSVALMSASPEALRIVGRDSYALGAPLTSFWAGTAGARKIRDAARRLTLYPWYHGLTFNGLEAIIASDNRRML